MILYVQVNYIHYVNTKVNLRKNLDGIILLEGLQSKFTDILSIGFSCLMRWRLFL